MTDMHILPDAEPTTLVAQIRSLAAGENTATSLLANTASLLFWSLRDINWLGFYLAIGDTLRLGPFHGKPACVSIAVGKGVCGTAAATGETLVVPDVDAFPGHIACDTASRSEIVVPIVLHGSLYGVLDVDSPVLDRFGATERVLFERVVEVLQSAIAESRLPDTACIP
jgi:L-methionine (R)-S-oxide reductase